jgi:hypothetical protein
MVGLLLAVSSNHLALREEVLLSSTTLVGARGWSTLIALVVFELVVAVLTVAALGATVLIEPVGANI